MLAYTVAASRRGPYVGATAETSIDAPIPIQVHHIDELLFPAILSSKPLPAHAPPPPI